MFIHICSLLMFSSQRVLFLDSILCYPITFSVNHAANFRVDKFPWFSSLAHSILLESTTLSHCSEMHQPPAEMLQPGRCHLLTAPKIPALWLQSLGPICSPDSHISLTLSGTTHCCRLAVFIIDYPTLSPGDSLSVRAIVASQHRHQPHHRPTL